MQIGYSKIHRAGVAPDARGSEMLCYGGGSKQLEMLGAVPGVQFWPDYNCLALPANRDNCLLLETVGQIEEATEDYVSLRNRLLKVPDRFAETYPFPSEGEPEPYPHQVDTFCAAREWFAAGHQGFGILSEMGTGKSRVAIDLMRAYVFQKSLIVGQNSTMLQWKAHLERSWPEAALVMLTEVPVPERVARVEAQIKAFKDWNGWPVVFLLNWESLARLLPVLKKLKPEMVVADEVSRIKERTTVMAKAAHKLAEFIPYRLALTGTPFGNSPADIWSIYRYLEPEIFSKSYWQFARKYFRLGGFTGREFVGFDSLNVHDFIRRMYSCAYRTTKACIGDLPEKEHEVISFEMEPEQDKLYRQMEADLYAERLAADGSREVLKAHSALDQVVRLQQITAGLYPISETKECRFIPSPKTTWLAHYVFDKLSQSDAHMIIWTKFIKEREQILTAFRQAHVPDEAVGYIDGSVSPAEREALRQRFNNREYPLRVLVVQVQAGAYGMDAKSCDTMIYHSLTFSWLERSQSTERGHRLGRTRAYKIIDLVCSQTIDEKIVKAIKRKQSLSDLLLVGGSGLGTKAGNNLRAD